MVERNILFISESFILTGSFNPLPNRNDYNNLLLIESTTLANYFSQTYNQLLKSKKEPSSHSTFIHNNISLSLFSCPQDNCQQQLLSSLAQANTSIQFALFTFTDKKVSDILIAKKNQGVLVHGVVESWQSPYTVYPDLIAQGIPVCLERSSVLQHNKVFVIDDNIVITGSYNPTKAAYTINDELLIMIHSKDIALFYKNLIDRINNASCLQTPPE